MCVIQQNDHPLFCNSYILDIFVVKECHLTLSPCARHRSLFGIYLWCSEHVTDVMCLEPVQTFAPSLLYGLWIYGSGLT